MHGTLSPRFPPHGVALPTASPASEPPTGFLAPLPVTAVLPAWLGSVHAPGVTPTACFRLAPLVPIEPGPPARASVDLAVGPPGNAARPAYPEPAHALVDNLFLQTGLGQRYSDRQEIRPADQSSASVTKLRSAHSARSLAVRLGLSVPSQVAPLDSSSYWRVVVPGSPQILPTQCTLDSYCVNKCPICQWAAESALHADALGCDVQGQTAYAHRHRPQHRLDCGEYRGWLRCVLVARPPHREQGQLWGELAEVSVLPAETASRRSPSECHGTSQRPAGCAPALLRQDSTSLLRQARELTPRAVPGGVLPA